LSKLIDATIRIRTKDGIVEYEIVKNGVDEFEWHCTEVTNYQHSFFMAEGILKLLNEEYP